MGAVGLGDGFHQHEIVDRPAHRRTFRHLTPRGLPQQGDVRHMRARIDRKTRGLQRSIQGTDQLDVLRRRLARPQPADAVVPQ